MRKGACAAPARCHVSVVFGTHSSPAGLCRGWAAGQTRGPVARGPSWGRGRSLARGGHELAVSPSVGLRLPDSRLQDCWRRLSRRLELRVLRHGGRPVQLAGVDERALLPRGLSRHLLHRVLPGRASRCQDRREVHPRHTWSYMPPNMPPASVWGWEGY